MARLLFLLGFTVGLVVSAPLEDSYGTIWKRQFNLGPLFGLPITSGSIAQFMGEPEASEYSCSADLNILLYILPTYQLST
jgi:hypothetical protein